MNTSLLLTAILGLFFVAGIIIIRLSNRHVIEHISISLAAGAMIALACTDLIPEVVLESLEAGKLWRLAFIIVGFLILKGLDTFVPEHEAHDDHNEESMAHIGIMSAIAITIHNVIEGMTVFSIAERDFSAGLSLGVGVGLHNIPMGMLIYATLAHEKGFKKNALLVLTVLSTFFGGILMALLSSLLTETVIFVMVCITLGMVAFIVCCELVPTIRKNPDRRRSVFSMAIGFLIVLLSGIFE